ncbi:MAG: NAD(P)-binding domain-containing protein [Thermoplasmata archaeon]
MKVGILGSGDVARALATGFVTAGHEVRLGTRHPEQPKVVEWVRGSGGKGATASPAEAAAYGELVVLAVPGIAVPEAVQSAGPAHFNGKVVIDPTNPLAFRENAPPSLAISGTTSGGEELQKLLPHSRVVKAFNIVGNAHFFRPNFPGGPPDMYICGNDAGAKQQVEQLLHAFGWPSVIDLGGIEGSRELESLCILWVKSALKLGNWNIAFKLLRK